MKTAVFYHGLLRTPGEPNLRDSALALVQSQLAYLEATGLEYDELRIGINGPASDAMLVSCLAPSDAQILSFPEGQSELATLHALQDWLQPGWRVLYWHAKGFQYPDNPVWDRWRHCMERACLWNWRGCVEALKTHHTVGAHWMVDSKYPMVPSGQRYWGGNFWWANSDYLMTLPPLPPDTRENRYDAEVWIGKSPKKPEVMDFAPHFPMTCPP